MGIVLGTGEWDNTRHESHRLSEILNSKGIKHWLDDGKWRGHRLELLARHAALQKSFEPRFLTQAAALAR
jgi:hypothetical protein